MQVLVYTPNLIDPYSFSSLLSLQSRQHYLFEFGLWGQNNYPPSKRASISYFCFAKLASSDSLMPKVHGGNIPLI